MADEKVNPIQAQKFLKGIDYPASKQEVLETARRNKADDNVLSTLERIPDREYEGPTNVTKAIGELS